MSNFVILGMKILIAPDKFRGSLSAMQVCNAVEEGIHRFNSSIETIKHPLADGGEGTLEILQNYFVLTNVEIPVKDPLFKDITASYMVSDDTAFIEMANASGLQLLEKQERNCYHTSTFGTGQLILDAVKKGFKKIILFIGGSATNDAGIGMAAALGYRFYDSEMRRIEPTGKGLIDISVIDDKDLWIDVNEIRFTVVCDVKNPLYGKNGAAFVYGSQKGASPQEIELLDLGLINFSKQVEKYLNKSVADIPGSGAAGGLGAGAICFLNAEMQSGIDFVMEQTAFEDALKSGVTLIITGEGCVDKQTIEGKVIKGVSEMAAKHQIPFSIICGSVKDEEQIIQNLNPKSIHSIMELGVTVEDAMQNASTHVSTIAYQLMHEI